MFDPRRTYKPRRQLLCERAIMNLPWNPFVPLEKNDYAYLGMVIINPFS